MESPEGNSKNSTNTGKNSSKEEYQDPITVKESSLHKSISVVTNTAKVVIKRQKMGDETDQDIARSIEAERKTPIEGSQKRKIIQADDSSTTPEDPVMKDEAAPRKSPENDPVNNITCDENKLVTPEGQTEEVKDIAEDASVDKDGVLTAPEAHRENGVAAEKAVSEVQRETAEDDKPDRVETNENQLKNEPAIRKRNLEQNGDMNLEQIQTKKKRRKQKKKSVKTRDTLEIREVTSESTVHSPAETSANIEENTAQVHMASNRYASLYEERTFSGVKPQSPENELFQRQNTTRTSRALKMDLARPSLHLYSTAETSSYKRNEMKTKFKSFQSSQTITRSTTKKSYSREFGYPYEDTLKSQKSGKKKGAPWRVKWRHLLLYVFLLLLSFLLLWNQNYELAIKQSRQYLRSSALLSPMIEAVFGQSDVVDDDVLTSAETEA